MAAAVSSGVKVYEPVSAWKVGEKESYVEGLIEIHRCYMLGTAHFVFETSEQAGNAVKDVFWPQHNILRFGYGPHNIPGKRVLNFCVMPLQIDQSVRTAADVVKAAHFALMANADQPKKVPIITILPESLEESLQTNKYFTLPLRTE